MRKGEGLAAGRQWEGRGRRRNSHLAFYLPMGKRGENDLKKSHAWQQQQQHIHQHSSCNGMAKYQLSSSQVSDVYSIS